jgi:FMN-dependent oxidoreductase (nitrilotriacetate monooxygenase family)
MAQKRQLHLNANVLASGRHNAAWRLEKNPNAVADIDTFIEIAAIAERGKFDAIFLADHPSLDDSAKDRPWHSLDPAILVAALSASTDRIGFVATASTTFDHPYHIARRYASLDHVSKGRAAWNIVTTQHEASAGNFGMDGLPAHGDRYSRAEELVDVVVKLWDSWGDDAVVADAKSGKFVDFNQVYPIDHSGEHFDVRGPLNVPRTPQGRPVLVQAGSSDASKRLGSRWADALFTVQRTIEEAKEFYSEIGARAQAFGRDRAPLILPGLYPVVGSTEAEAWKRKNEMDALLDLEEERKKLALRFNYPAEKLQLDSRLPDDLLDNVNPNVSRGFVENVVRETKRAGWTIRELLGRNPLGGHRLIVGSPEQIADEMELWFHEYAADGFNLNMDGFPSGLALFVDHVVPELQKRGIFRRDYEGTTLRDHFGLERPLDPAVVRSLHASAGLRPVQHRKSRNIVQLAGE